MATILLGIAISVGIYFYNRKPDLSLSTSWFSIYNGKSFENGVDVFIINQSSAFQIVKANWVVKDTEYRLDFPKNTINSKRTFLFRINENKLEKAKDSHVLLKYTYLNCSLEQQLQLTV